MTRVIGSQNDVPDTGDPIVSPWYQDTANKIVHVFASTAARDAWVSPPDGAVCQAPAGRWWNRVGGAWVSPNRDVVGTVLSATLTADQVLVQMAGNLVLPSTPARFLVIYTVMLSSTASLNTLIRMYGTLAPAGYFDYHVTAGTTQSATFTQLAGASASISVYGSSRSGVPASTFGDGGNHTLTAIGLI